jgi:putative serine protease PepD
VLAIGIVSGVVGGVIGAQFSDSTNSGSVSRTVVTAPPVEAGAFGDSTVAKAASAIAPSIVTVTATGSMGGGVGTGVVITSDGQIITNHHVVAGSTTVKVLLNGETNPRDAKVLASDAGNDLALLELTEPVSGLTVAVFADPGSIAVGDPVVAAGYALDLDGAPSITSGIISALDRTLVMDDGVLNSLIQTDAAISSGNSGGPLINLAGQVVGINTAVARSDFGTAANNIGFAISVGEVLRVLEILRDVADGGTREEGFLGVSLGVRQEGGSGAVVTEVESDSPASEAGIKVDDVILEVNGQTITGQGALIAVIRDSAPGDEVEIVVERGGERLTLTAVLAARPN